MKSKKSILRLSLSLRPQFLDENHSAQRPRARAENQGAYFLRSRKAPKNFVPWPSERVLRFRSRCEKQLASLWVKVEARRNHFDRMLIFLLPILECREDRRRHRTARVSTEQDQQGNRCCHWRRTQGERVFKFDSFCSILLTFSSRILMATKWP